MFIFYGTGSSCVATEPLPGLACVHCHTQDSVVCSVFSRCVKLMFTPLFPYGKRSVTVCRHCQQTLTGKALPADYRAPVQAVQNRAPTPLSNFAGLLLIGGLVAAVFIYGFFGPAPKPRAALPQAPFAAETVGARYRIDAAASGVPYVLSEVTRVTPDSVFCNMSLPLRAPLSAASATRALRDSIPDNGARGLSAAEWHAATTGAGPFKRVE